MALVISGVRFNICYNEKMLAQKFALYLKYDCGLSVKTIEAYTNDVKLLLRSHPSPLQLTSLHLQNYIDKLHCSGIGPRSIARKLSSFRLFFKFLSQENTSFTDPTHHFKSPKIPRSLPKTLSIDQVDTLLKTPDEHTTDSIMLRLLYASGMRVSELISLKMNQVDLQAGVLKVQGKGSKIRIIPIDSETVKFLMHYIQSIRNTAKTDILFLSHHKKPFTRQGFWKLVKKYSKRAEISVPVSPHVLRHAFATHLLERGMNLRSLQMLLGHSDISTTEIYSHISKSHLHEALRKYHPRSKIRKA